MTEKNNPQPFGWGLFTLPSLDRSLFALVVVEDDFAHTHGLGSDFDKLILLDVFEALFQRHDGLRDDAHW